MKASRMRRRTGIAYLFIWIALVGLLAAPAVAQTTTGSIYGTVADQTGAVVPNAAVTVKNVETGETHSAQSNASGNYTFPALVPGDYVAFAKVKGFQPAGQDRIRLDANQNVHVSFALQAGSQDQAVTVSAAATTLVDTRESQLGTTVEQKQMHDLPLNGRNAYDLVQIVPGVTNYTAATPGGDSTGTTFQVNGNRPYDNSFYLDGVFDSTIYRNGGSEMPNPDALQEFRVLTSNFDAEFGREPGGVVNAVTRSGTNQFHGVLYDYLRNNILNAKGYFDSGVTTLKRNQFGGAFGGPIRHDKMFFFGSYEGLRLRTTATATSASYLTPTSAEATGNFSADAAQPTLPAGTNCGTPTAEVICTGSLDPVAQYLIKTYVPLTDPVTGTPEQTASAPSNGNQYLGRVDDQLNAQHKLSAMFFNSRTRTTVPNQGQNVIFDFTQAATFDNQTNATVSDSWIVSPNALNDLRVFYALNHYEVNAVYGSTWSNYGSQVAQAGSLARQPLITIAGYWAMGLDGQGPQNLSMQQGGITDTFNWSHGNHNIKMGGSLIWNKYAETGVFLESGKVTFTGTKTTALANFLLGHSNTFEQNSGAYHRLQSYNPALFAQDDWKLTRRLTLNLGLRWELYPPYTGQNNFGTFEPGVQSVRFPTAPLGLLTSGDPGIPDGIRHTSYKDFAPRVGFAYDVFGNGTTSLRGAYGIFYSASEETLEGNLEQQPFELDVLLSGATSLVCPYGGAVPPCPGTGTDPFPYVINPPKFTSGATIYSMPPNTNKVPNVQQYNLTLQQQLSRNWSLQVAYVGSVSREFYLMRDQNSAVYSPGAGTGTAALNARRPYQPTPSTYTFGEISELDPAGNASYNALQATVTRRFTHNLSLLASYVWARDIDFVSADPNTALQLTDENNIWRDKGLSDTAVPQRFVASYIWALPSVQHWGVIGKQVLSGWQLNGITTLQSGTPFTVTSGTDTNLDGNNNDRPNQVGNPFLPGGRSRSQKVAEFFNTAAFAPVPANTPYGNVHRASLLGPKSMNTDLSAFKSFPVWRGSALQFRGEIFNIFNNVNLGNPNGVLSNKQFGTITSTNSGPSGKPRIVQFALRYSF